MKMNTSNLKTISFGSSIATRLLLMVVLCLGVGESWGQSYLGLDGGLEGSATIDNVGITGPVAAKWTKNNATQTIANETGTIRSGANSLRVNNSSTTGRRVWSPNFTIVSTTSQVTIQYYKRVASITNSQEDQPAIINNNEGLSGSYNAFPNVANSWVKVTYTKASSTFTTISGLLLHRAIGSGGDMFIDDMSVYAGAVDNTAPNAPSVPVIGSATSTSLSVAWAAASGGVDGGGYMVVRGTSDPITAPNSNGIYAVGNTIAAGMTVVYNGTSTSFVDNGLTAGVTYFYRIYTYDKAYNYSTALTGNGTTLIGAAPTKLVITSISPASPIVGSGFNVTVQAQDATNVVSNVVSNTSFSLTNTGGGAIGGTTTATITAGTSQVAVSGVTLSNSGTGITLTATVTSGDVLTAGISSAFTVVPADPTAVTATTASSSQINLAATANANNNNIVVIFNSSGTFTAPTAGSAPGSVGSTLTGSGGTIIYAGVASAINNHSSLTTNQLYFYKTFSYDGNNLYSAGVTANATTQAIALTGSIGTLTSPTATTATAPTTGNSITVGGGATLSARGLAIGISPSPTTTVSSGTTAVTYSQTLSGLNSQTLYYTRAYATNAGGTSYGNDVNFRTLSAVVTAQPTSLAATQTSNSSFNVTLTGSATYPASGATKAGYLLLYGTTSPSLIASPNGLAPASVINSGTPISVAETSLPTTPVVTGLTATGLAPNTTYSLLIVPYTWDGTNPETYNYFTSGARTATVTLSTTVSLPYTQDFEAAAGEWVFSSASGLNKWAIGSATNNGGAKALYISNDNGTSNSYTITTTETGADASLKVDLTGATAALLSFDWKSNGESIGASFFDFGEIYLNNGGTDILISSANEFQGTTAFARRNISLTPYVGGLVTIKFRWKNDGSSGNQPPFAVDNVSIVASDFATLTTTTVTGVTMTNASSGGNITNDGASTVTARGIVWGTTQNPTIPSANSTTDGTGAGIFTSSLTGLTDNTLYYVRAYATNSTGTSYGNQVSFTTSSVAATTAASATSVAYNSFIANWGAVSGATGYKLDVSNVSTFVGAPTTFISEPFENALTGFTQTTGTGTFPTGNSASGDRPASSPFAIAGTYSFAKTGGSVTITSNDINTFGATNVQLNFRLAAFSIGSTGNGMDIGDIVTVEVSPDGGTNYYSTLRVLGNSNAFWAYSATGIASSSYDGDITPVDFQPSGGGSRTTDGYSRITISSLPASANLKIRITLLNDNGAERWVIDDLAITGNPLLCIPGYQDLSVSGTSQAVTGLTANTNYYYRVRSVASNSTSANSNTISVLTIQNPATTNYRSASSGDYTSAATWEYNDVGTNYVAATQAPGPDNSVTIQAGHVVSLTVNQTLNAALNISATGSLSIGSNTLTLNGTVTGAGTLTGSSTSNVVIGGTGALGSLNFNQTTDGTTNVLNSMTVNRTGTLSLGNKLVILDSYIPTAGVLTTGGFLTLRSTATKTARIASNTSGSDYISGNVNVERYIPARRAWKLVTAPVRNAGFIWNNWQNNGTASSSYGVNIWGPAGTNPVPGANGLNQGPAYSMKQYVGASNDWSNPVTNTKTRSLSTNAGTNNGGAADNQSFLLFVTNPYDAAGTNITPTGSALTTLSAAGALQQGDQTFAVGQLSGTNQYVPVGNPYASPVDFTQLITLGSNASAIEDRFWVYDATQATLGGYQLVYNSGGGAYLVVPAPFSGGTAAGDYVHLQSGQAVFVEPKSGGTGTVTFKETHKSVPGTTPPVFLVPPRSLAINLYNGSQLLDGTLMLVDNNYSAAIVAAEDVKKVYNDGSNLAIARNNTGYIVEARPEITNKDTSYLWMSGIQANQTYRFSFKATRFDPELKAWLEDAFTNTKTPVDLSGTVNDISFSTTADAASRHYARFRIVYKNLAALPVSFSDVKAAKQNTAVKVEWTVIGEQDADHYEVEYSTNGVQFNALGNVRATGNNGSTVNYSYLHGTPVNGINYYRIKLVDVSGSIIYSLIVNADLGTKGAPGIVVYPNPVINKQAAIELRNLPAGNYVLSIFNSNGQLVSQSTMNHNGGTASRQLPVDAVKNTGVYRLQVKGADNAIFNTTITVQ